MTIDLSPHKVQTFPGINDTPVEPTSTKGGNGSHLIGKHNDLIDSISNLLNSFLDNFDTLSNDISTLSDDLNTLSTTINNIPSAEALYPTNYTHWHVDSTVTNGGALITQNFADQPFNTVAKQEPSDYYDTFKFSTLLKAGTYTMRVTARTSNDGGYFVLYLNNFNTQLTPNGLSLNDPVEAPITFNIPFTIPTSGEHTFLFRQQSGAPNQRSLQITKMYINQS